MLRSAASLPASSEAFTNLSTAEREVFVCAVKRLDYRYPISVISDTLVRYEVQTSSGISSHVIASRRLVSFIYISI